MGLFHHRNDGIAESLLTELDLPAPSEEAVWAHAVSRALQLFVGRTIEMDPAYFKRGIRFLSRELPPARTSWEREQLRRSLVESCLRTAIQMERAYARVAPGHSAAPPVKTIEVLWRDRAVDPRWTIRHWGREFLAAFNETHPWPPAVRAAIILRKQRRRWVRLEALCRRIGVSSSALTRDFQRAFGLSSGEYHRRAKLEWVVAELRQPDSNVESIALRAGYSRVPSLYHALRVQTGLTPSDIRRLSRDELLNLVETRLALHARGDRVTRVGAVSREQTCAAHRS